MCIKIAPIISIRTQVMTRVLVNLVYLSDCRFERQNFSVPHTENYFAATPQYIMDEPL